MVAEGQRARPIDSISHDVLHAPLADMWMRVAHATGGQLEHCTLTSMQIVSYSSCKAAASGHLPLTAGCITNGGATENIGEILGAQWMQRGQVLHLVLLHGEAAAFWDVVLAVLAAEQAGRQGTPHGGPQAVLAA